MKKIPHYALTYLLGKSEDVLASFFKFHMYFRGLEDDAEILNDALHLLINSGDFGCPEDGVKAIIWAMILDFEGHNFLLPEHDALRNGKAAAFLLQDLCCDDQKKSDDEMNEFLDGSLSCEEVTGDA